MRKLGSSLSHTARLRSMRMYLTFFGVAILATTPKPALPIEDIRPSYAAGYELRLVHASSSEGPRAAVGAIESVFQESCDGWETRNRTVADLAFGDSKNFTNERFFESWESKDGASYRFSVHTLKNGRTIESFGGGASTHASGGEAYYQAIDENGDPAGDRYSLDLPKGTMFPVSHSQKLLENAEAGVSLVRYVVLNGASSTGPRVVSAVIGSRVEQAEIPNTLNDATGDDIEMLLSGPGWRMSIARYNLFDARETPDTELFFKLNKTGVIESFEQKFDDFSLSAHLVYLRRLERPEC